MMFEPTTVATGRELRAGDHRREGVENVMLGLLGDVRRQRAIFRSGHVHAERSHDGTHDLRAKRGSRQERCG
jgi:hypothetical protein